MATQESNVRGGGFLNGVFMLVALVVILGIGFAFWPKIRAAYYATPPAASEPPAQPTADTSALDAIKAQVLRLEAQLAAAKAQQQVIVQPVAPGEAPPAEPKAHTPASTDRDVSTSTGDTTGKPAKPAAAPIVIVSHEGYQQPVITGSGACAAAKGARRCGK
jgi:hypothetical protein